MPFSPFLPVALGALALSALLHGCAAKPPTLGASPEGKSARSDTLSGQDWESLRAGLETREDSLVLDLWLGFRALNANVPADKQDAAAIAQGRRAYDALEARLRQGGLSARASDPGLDPKAYGAGRQDGQSLRDILLAAHKAAQQSVLEGDMAKARARNSDIVHNRPVLSFAVEDALWALALIDALEAPGMPVVTKRKLRALHEAYFQDAPQDEIVRQVNGVLAEIADEKLRQQLKKLANRAWERDRRANRLPQGSKKTSTGDTAAIPAALSVTTVTAVTAATTVAAITTPATPMTPASSASASPSAPADSGSHAMMDGGQQTQVDSLIRGGQYVPALRALESLDAAAHADFIRDRRQRAGERFCDDRRRSAAETYKRVRAANTDALKSQLLQRTAADLDSCLFYFPETSVGGKVRRNREMVEAEMQKLKR